MLDPDVIDRIRHIFLHPRPHLSIFQATLLLGWTRHQMDEAIASGDVELMTTPIGKWFWRHELMSKALETWPLDVIEEALGANADGVLPQAIRTKELRVRLPRHHVDMLEYRAEQETDHRQRRSRPRAGRHRQRPRGRALRRDSRLRRGAYMA
jgi:hypothetical protein